MNDYFIRCKQSDVQQLYALAVALGVLVESEGVYSMAPGRVGAWDVVGAVYRPTGAIVTVDGQEQAETAPVADAVGAPFWHANLRVDADLAGLAAALAPTSPAIAAGLSDLARWFVVGEDGRATAPDEPARVWL